MKLQKEIKLAGTDGYDRQISKKEMKLNVNNRTKPRLFEIAKKVKLKLQMTPEKPKTSSWISEKKRKQKLDIHMKLVKSDSGFGGLWRGIR